MHAQPVFGRSNGHAICESRLGSLQAAAWYELAVLGKVRGVVVVQQRQRKMIVFDTYVDLMQENAKRPDIGLLVDLASSEAFRRLRTQRIKQTRLRARTMIV